MCVPNEANATRSFETRLSEELQTVISLSYGNISVLQLVINTCGPGVIHLVDGM